MDEETFDASSLDDLILMGVVEVDSIDEEGNFLYGFTENAKDIAPEFFDKATESFYSDIMGLWSKGFVSMDITVPNPIITITEKAFDEDEVRKLDAKSIMTLKFVIMALKKQ